MNTSRRRFVSTLAAATVGVAADPELLAWEPGARSFFDFNVQGLHDQYLRDRFRSTGVDWYKDEYWIVNHQHAPLRLSQPLDGNSWGLDLIPINYAGRAGQISPQGAASDGFVLTETMPRAEFKRRFGYLNLPPIAAKVGP